MNYSATEMMIVSAARALEGVQTVFVGVGMPNVACNVARLTVAPDLELIYESGIYGARPRRMPLSIGDPTLVTGAVAAVSIADIFGLYLQGGRIDVAFLGGAQIDRFGNLNSTVIGDYAQPTTRLPGSGGATEIAANASRVFHLIRLGRRSFVDKLDFVTSAGHLAGGESRRQYGLRGHGPVLVVTDMAVLNFENPDREMQLVSLYPGATQEDVAEAVGWRLRVAEHVANMPAPTKTELAILRDKLDHNGLFSA